MDMTTSSSSSAVICAENIALLYLLHPIPVLPSCNDINARLTRQGSYSLSFDQERSLASTLAFLANIKDDPSHVPALCIEERVESASLDVVLAVNKTTYGDGKELLGNLKHRFDEIFAILSEVSEARDQTRALEHRLFSSIVSMCSSRILNRLRFKKGKRRAAKQPLQAVIGEAIASLRQLDQDILHGASVALFIERARDIVRLADSWVKHQKPAELETMVEGVFRLKQVQDFGKLLGLIPNCAMSPCSRRNLANIVSKVARYRETAQILCRMARKVPLLRRATIKLVDLPEHAFFRSQSTQSFQLTSTLARCSPTSRGLDFGYLCGLLKEKSAQLNKQFASQTRNSLWEAKIHAEIQLLVYYESNESRLPPRVVCSSKDACFLCNTAIQLHGKMHTPRSHGRLYPGWRLPSLPVLGDFQSRLNTALENHIEESVRMLMLRKSKIVYPDPKESTLLTLRLSTSTLRTASALAEAHSRSEASAAEAATGTETEHRLGALMLPNPESSPCASSSESGDTARRTQLSKSESSIEPPTRSTTRIGPQVTVSVDTTDHIADLIQGHSQVSSVAAGQHPRLHLAGTLELHMECCTIADVVADNGKPGITYDIEWLSINETTRIVQNQAITIIDVETMQQNVSQEIEYKDDIFVMARGSLVRIRPHNQGPRSQMKKDVDIEAPCEKAEANA